MSADQRKHSDISTAITIVVPTRNSSRTIESCLASLRQQTKPCRVIVVDNHSTDDTSRLAAPLAHSILKAGPERSAQRNLGAQAYPAPMVGFIDSDMVLTPNVVAEAWELIEAGAAGVIVPETTIGSGYWAGVRAFERSLYLGNSNIEAARFFRWDAFKAAGAFDESLTGPEDWRLTDEIRKIGPVERTTAIIYHDEGSIGFLEACRKKAYYADGLYRFAQTQGVRSLTKHLITREWIRRPSLLMRSRYGIGIVLLKAGETIAVSQAMATKRIRE